MKSFDEIREYLNSLKKFDKETIALVETALIDRKTMIINDVPVIDGKLAIEKKLKSPKISKWMERMLRETLALEKAKVTIKGMIN